ncbi:Flp pilus assembly protein CpaB [candidate division KSB1 bacterium]|nr:Flp pilus assembly protein CpaB [candidate division KSB1 bacterium]
MNNANQEQGMVTKIRQDRTILFIAVLSGVVAVILLMWYMNKKERMYGTKVPVLVAAVDIRKGEPFTQANLEVAEIPQKFVIPNVIGPAYLTSILDSKSLVAISKGQQISWNYPEVAEVSERLSNSLLKEGNERAVTISVDEISGIAGHITENDRVDVVVTFQVPTQDGKSVQTRTKTLLQCITVLAVGMKKSVAATPAIGGQNPAQFMLEAYNSVTLKVTPEEAELLSFASTAGTLRLLLRNPDDLEINENIPEVGFENLYDIEKKTTQNRRRIVVHQGGTTQ